MTAGNLAEIAALVGDPARANMLSALLGGRALTASELAYHAGISAQTASGHLAKLTEGGLLACAPQGRHRYFRLASPLVARMLEGIMAVVDAGPRWRGGEALRDARTCYDHLAGRLAVGLADAMVARGHVVLADDGGEVTPAGSAFLCDLGVDVSSVTKRVFCKPCLDWSERRPHIAGAVGAALARRALEARWVERIKDSRALSVTPAGRLAFNEAFGLRLAPADHAAVLRPRASVSRAAV